MARGWESKSVEEQQAEFTKNSESNDGTLPKEDKARVTERRRLQLARVNVANQLNIAQNPRYVDLLTRELEELDRKISSLN
jgi:ribosomal protein L20